MHVQMSTDGRLHQQAVQGNITQMLGYLHFKNNRTNATDNTRRLGRGGVQIDFVQRYYIVFLSSDKDMVKRSFDVCEITTLEPAKVRSGSFYDKCMRNAKSVIEANELEDENPFEL